MDQPDENTPPTQRLDYGARRSIANQCSVASLTNLTLVNPKWRKPSKDRIQEIRRWPDSQYLAFVLNCTQEQCHDIIARVTEFCQFHVPNYNLGAAQLTSAVREHIANHLGVKGVKGLCKAFTPQNIQQLGLIRYNAVLGFPTSHGLSLQCATIGLTLIGITLAHIAPTDPTTHLNTVIADWLILSVRHNEECARIGRLVDSYIQQFSSTSTATPVPKL